MTKKVLKYSDLKTIKSHNLEQYLTVYNRYTSNEAGYIGNISNNSILVFTPWMMEVGSIFNFKIILPELIGNKKEINFDAKCQWCHPDIDPKGYDSGYTILSSDGEYKYLILLLHEYFCFRS